ncbi:hypothetical protein [Dactylosporangium sp. NPDC051541]|uniref:hypothetical protein n=1 Tax=Dactylosporangium sp. NPDC051541 TaxID=3363977 RepID=UPI0037B654AE
MPIKIRSLLTSGPVWVPLATGSNLRLSPGELSADLPDVAVAGSAAVDAQRQRGVIDVEPVSDVADGATVGTEKAAAEPARTRKQPDSAG